MKYLAIAACLLATGCIQQNPIPYERTERIIQKEYIPIQTNPHFPPHHHVPPYPRPCPPPQQHHHHHGGGGIDLHIGINGDHDRHR